MIMRLDLNGMEEIIEDVKNPKDYITGILEQEHGKKLDVYFNQDISKFDNSDIFISKGQIDMLPIGKVCFIQV